MDDHILELIHRQIDGINSPVERRELEAALASDVDARVLYNDLSATADALEKVGAHEPPPRIKRAIMAALPTQLYAPARPRRTSALMEVIRGMLTTRPRLAYAYTFVVGLVVGLSLFGVWDNVVRDAPNAVHATLISKDAIAAMQPVQVLPFDLDDVEGAVRIMVSEDRQAILDVSLIARRPVEVVITFDEASLPLRGFTRLNGEPGATLRIESGHARLTAQGQHAFLVAFDSYHAASKIRIQILQEGRVRYEEIVEAGKPSA